MRELGTPRTDPERFMLQVYQEADGEIAAELADLEHAGVRPSCKRGCHDCCRQPILSTTPEAG